MEAFARDVARHLLPHLPDLLAAGAGDQDVEPLALAQGRFCAALVRANERLNLTGIVDPEGMAVRHVLDALLALPVIGDLGTLVDLGSGCGVPGIPLALALPERPVVLLESRQKKATALAELIDELGLAPRVRAVRARGEEWLVEQRAGDLVTRAVGTVASQLELLRPVADRFDRLVMLKGPAGDDELEAARVQLRPYGGPGAVRRVETRLPGEAGERLLLVLPGLPPRSGRGRRGVRPRSGRRSRGA